LGASEAARDEMSLERGATASAITHTDESRDSMVTIRRNSVRLPAICLALCAIPLLMHVARAAQSSPASLDSLAREVERTESIRAVKNLQYAYSHYAQFGLWTDMGALFATDGEEIWGSETATGPDGIARRNMTRFGGGKPGLPSGVVNTHLVEVPLVNLSADGTRATARWYGLSMLGGGAEARWESGTFQNEYVKEGGVWKISRLHFHPQFAGLYEKGWSNVSNPLPLVPYSFRTEAEAGTPIPPAAGAPSKTTASLASLEQRIERLVAEDLARNLQNAWGYYIDRRMWDDVVDLFTADAVLEVGGAGIYDGPANIRRALERSGPAGLKTGQLNDHPLFDTLIEVAPNALEARVRGIDLGMTGEFSTGTAHWSVTVFQNRFVKQDGVWKIREMRTFPLFETDYQQGWGKSRIVHPAPEKAFAPSRPLPAADAGDNPIPAFLPHPVTGKDASYPPGATVAARERLRPALTSRTAAASGTQAARIAEAERRLAVARAYDGAMNVTAAYTHYIDDGQWTSIGAIFAERGGKHVPFNGYYFGPERIAHRPGAKPAVNSTNPGRGGWHWLLQPVVHVAVDGRSAKMRTRLFHPAASATGGGIEGGMYPNNQAVLENGVWKLWNLTIDEPYFSAPFPHGWSRPAPPRPAPAAAPRPANTPPPLAGKDIYPPDINQNLLGRRMEGFVGGTGEAIRWPGLLNMWFHYRNPVSGRVPSHYWPNCGTCEYAPSTSMEHYGYILPPS
jgi:hypothetical protein